MAVALPEHEIGANIKIHLLRLKYMPAAAQSCLTFQTSTAGGSDLGVSSHQYLAGVQQQVYSKNPFRLGTRHDRAGAESPSVQQRCVLASPLSCGPTLLWAFIVSGGGGSEASIWVRRVTGPSFQRRDSVFLASRSLTIIPFFSF